MFSINLERNWNGQTTNMNFTKESICCYTTFIICIVQCILLFLPYYIWNKSCLLFDDFWNTWNPHPPIMLLFLRHFWRSQNNLHYMSEGPFSEIHGVRIKLQTLTYLFLIMIIRRKNYLEFRRKIHPTYNFTMFKQLIFE